MKFIGSILLVLTASAGQAQEIAERGGRPAEPFTIPTPASPRGNPGAWATSDDYPPAALRDDVEGVSRFVATIGKDGRVTRCDITISSGSEELDAATCALITQRGIFSPARNDRGEPIEGSWNSAVRWQIPTEKARPEPVFLVLSYVVDVDGSVSDCKVERHEGVNALGADNLADACPSALREPYLDADGNPVKRRVRTMFRIVVEPA